MQNQSVDQMIQEARNRRQAENSGIEEMIRQARAKRDRELCDWIADITGVPAPNRFQQAAAESRPERPAQENLEALVAKEVTKQGQVLFKQADEYREKVNQIEDQYKEKISALEKKHSQKVKELKTEISKKNSSLEEVQNRLRQFESTNQIQLQQIDKNKSEIEKLLASKEQLRNLHEEGILKADGLKESLKAYEVKIDDLQRQNFELNQLEVHRNQLKKEIQKL